MQEHVVRPPRPTGIVLGLMVAIGCTWVMFAASLNWSRAPFAQTLWNALEGNGPLVLHGQVWRLVTAPLLHSPQTPSHALISVMMLYFFAAPLAAEWGSRRITWFLLGAAVVGNGLESLASLSPALATPRWFGAMTLANAATVAWAFENRHQVVRLFLIVPVRPLMMVGLLVFWQVALLVSRSPSAEGMVAPFGGMLAGWLFCDASPLRRFWLRKKLNRYQQELDALRAKDRERAKRRREGPALRLIRGGDDDGPRTLH
ncbi:MAG: rhomboid family intramembrane serine protease [Deltaproteobacteria bacterium]|nr:rhomboid family intramembrane serine protease [Deltaproteobacteria bacterium]